MFTILSLHYLSVHPSANTVLTHTTSNMTVTKTKTSEILYFLSKDLNKLISNNLFLLFRQDFKLSLSYQCLNRTFRYLWWDVSKYTAKKKFKKFSIRACGFATEVWWTFGLNCVLRSSAEVCSLHCSTCSRTNLHEWEIQSSGEHLPFRSRW